MKYIITFKNEIPEISNILNSISYEKIMDTIYLAELNSIQLQSLLNNSNIIDITDANKTLSINNTVTAIKEENFINLYENYNKVSELITKSIIENYKNTEIPIYFDLNTKQGDNWGLSRISKLNNDFTTFPYKSFYKFNKSGKNVDIYIVDTGINNIPTEFGLRINLLWSFNNVKIDDHGHGTHVASIAAGTLFGVAKFSNIHSVKVMNNRGSGTVLDIVKGLNEVLKHHQNKIKNNINTPSVLNFSISTSEILIANAMTQLIKNGIVCCVAAGNDGRNLDEISYYNSTAELINAITVGSSNIFDEQSRFSNYGKVVDIFAPGENIIAMINNNMAYINSGTSMATPHVVGCIALYLEDKNILQNELDVIKVQDYIKNNASKNKIKLTTFAQHTNTISDIIYTEINENKEIINYINGNNNNNLITLGSDLKFEINGGLGINTYILTKNQTNDVLISDNTNKNNLIIDNDVIIKNIELISNSLIIRLINNNKITILLPYNFNYYYKSNEYNTNSLIEAFKNNFKVQTPKKEQIISNNIKPVDGRSINELNKLFKRKR